MRLLPYASRPWRSASTPMSKPLMSCSQTMGRPSLSQARLKADGGAAVNLGAAARQVGDVTAQTLEQGLVVGDAAVGAAAHVYVHLGAADVEAGQLLALGALDEGGAGDDHVGLLGHVDPV